MLSIAKKAAKAAADKARREAAKKAAAEAKKKAAAKGKAEVKKATKPPKVAAGGAGKGGGRKYHLNAKHRLMLKKDLLNVM